MFSCALTNASCARSSASSALRTMPHATEMTRLRYFETRYSYASGRPAFVSAIAATSNGSSSFEPTLKLPHGTTKCRRLFCPSRAVGEELRGLCALLGGEHVECLRDAGEDVHLQRTLGVGLR